MNAANILAQLEVEGVRLSLAPAGGLQVSGAKEVVGRLLPLLRGHKAEIVALLTTAPPCPCGGVTHKVPQLGRAWSPGAPFVCRCGDYTGWATEGRPRCPLCEFDAVVDAVAHQKRMLAHADELGRVAAQTLDPEKRAARLAVVAAVRAEVMGAAFHRGGISGHAWCQDHLDELLAAGWSHAALFRRSWPLGLAWSQIWSARGVIVTLESGGLVVFAIQRPGRTVRQVARPHL